MQPLRRMGVDAAILFSDIMVPLAAVGIPVRIEPGRGPVVDEPIRTEADVARLRPLGSGPGRSSRPGSSPSHSKGARLFLCFGFAGAPFTLASYLVEGNPRRARMSARRH